MDAPDVLGMEWEEAEILVHEAGWTARLQRTAPPGAPPLPEESLRVIRVQADKDRRCLQILLAPERFLGTKGPVTPAAP